jgi:hypothetical protein
MVVGQKAAARVWKILRSNNRKMQARCRRCARASVKGGRAEVNLDPCTLNVDDDEARALDGNMQTVLIVIKPHNESDKVDNGFVFRV